MDNKRWVYPYDSKCERQRFKDIPKSVEDLKDDPFRSLAGELRRAGAFAKDTTPFSEFLWRIFCAAKYRARTWTMISTRPWRKPWALPGAGTQSICPAGADPPWTTRELRF